MTTSDRRARPPVQRSLLQAGWCLLLLSCSAAQGESSSESSGNEGGSEAASAESSLHASEPEAASPALPSPPPPAPISRCPQGFQCDFELLERDAAKRVNEVRIQKDAHRLSLLADGVVVRTYSMAMGWGGAGPKRMEGDGVTPVGTYTITGRLPKSPWHILLGVSYPNYEDVKRHAALKAKGEIPPTSNIGFGIAIHGHRADQADGEHKKTDWTLGCVALDRAEIEEVAALVKNGTKVVIED